MNLTVKKHFTLLSFSTETTGAHCTGIKHITKVKNIHNMDRTSQSSMVIACCSFSNYLLKKSALNHFDTTCTTLTVHVC